MTWRDYARSAFGGDLRRMPDPVPTPAVCDMCQDRAATVVSGVVDLCSRCAMAVTPPVAPPVLTAGDYDDLAAYAAVFDQGTADEFAYRAAADRADEMRNRSL